MMASLRIWALYIIPGSRQTPHIIYCRPGEDVRYHLVMTMTHTKTNTKKKARIKTNTKKKCFKGSLHVIFLKSMGLKDLKFYIGYHLLMTMTQHTNTKTKTKCFNDPRYDTFKKKTGVSMISSTIFSYQ